MEKAHKKLNVWQEAINLVKMIYLETQNLPKEELYGLTSQMRRAVVSIPSNIAEGAARRGRKESAQFFNIARGSISELDTQIIICHELELLEPSAVSRLTFTLEKVDSLLSGLIRYRKRVVNNCISRLKELEKETTILRNGVKIVRFNTYIHALSKRNAKFITSLSGLEKGLSNRVNSTASSYMAHFKHADSRKLQEKIKTQFGFIDEFKKYFNLTEPHYFSSLEKQQKFFSDAIRRFEYKCDEKGQIYFTSIPNIIFFNIGSCYYSIPGNRCFHVFGKHKYINEALSKGLSVYIISQRKDIRFNHKLITRSQEYLRKNIPRRKKVRYKIFLKVFLLIAGLIFIGFNNAYTADITAHYLGTGATYWNLPDTGQGLSYTATFGEDNDYEPAATQPSYTDNDDETVTDNRTGLMWLQEGNYPFNGTTSTGTWEEALTFCEGLSYAGYTDWRLPNARELMSIVNYQNFSPAIDTAYFLNTQSNYYWTSTTYVPGTTYAWRVYFSGGAMWYYEKTNTIYVRAVRSGP